MESLSKDESATYVMVTRRMLANFFKDVQQAHTKYMVDVAGLKSSELTGQWEYTLEMVRRGELTRDAFMGKVRQFTQSLTTNIKGATLQIAAPSKVALGSCPLCQADVFETSKVFTCASGRACTFVIFKSIAKKNISASVVKTLLKDGRTKPMKGFTSKAGKKFETALEILADGKIGFHFEDKKGAT